MNRTRIIALLLGLIGMTTTSMANHLKSYQRIIIQIGIGMTDHDIRT